MLDLALTVVVVILVLMFVTLLLKLNPSGEKRNDEEEIIQEVSGSGSKLGLQSKSQETFQSLQQGLESSSPINQEIDAHQSRQTSKKKEVSQEPSEETPRIVVSAAVGGESEVEKEPAMLSADELEEEPKATEPPSDPLPMSQNSVGKECPHKFGYLRGLPKNRPIPDECFGCPKIMECLVNKKES